MMNRKQREAAKKHGQRLLAIYPHATESRPSVLYKILRNLEVRGAMLAEQRCNDSKLTEKEADSIGRNILESVHRILGKGPAVFLNGDPRGYALKIEAEAAKELAIEKDWGGYGIIAPELNSEGF